MKTALLVLASLIVTQPACAGLWAGVVVAVTDDGCTIQPDYGEKRIMRFCPDMGKT